MSSRWRLLLLFAVIAPFLTTYLIRTIAWETILADASPIVHAQVPGDRPDDGQVLDTGGAVIAGLTYNFLPFMLLPIYASLERIDTSLIEAGKDLYASARQAFLRGHPAADHAWGGGRRPAHLHSGVRRLRQRGVPRWREQHHMVGNRIQATYLEESNYPEGRAALSFLMMAAVLVTVPIYIRTLAPRPSSARR